MGILDGDLTDEHRKLLQQPGKITIRPVSTKSLIEHRLDKLESLVERIASHLGIEG